MFNRSRTLAALPGGAVALFAHSAPYVLAALLLGPVLSGLPALADIVARWRADQPRRERERIVNQALLRIGQDDPERALVWLAYLPPVASPFERSPAEGPAPSIPVTPSGDPTAGGAAGTG